VQDLLTSNSKTKYIPNVICHYFGRKRHIVSNCKGKAWDYCWWGGQIPI
jgi:hypothetical protein